MLYAARRNQALGELLPAYIDRADRLGCLTTVPGFEDESLMCRTAISCGSYPSAVEGLRRLLVVSFVEYCPKPQAAVQRPYHVLSLLGGSEPDAPVATSAYHCADGSTIQYYHQPFPPNSDIVDVVDFVEALRWAVPQPVENPFGLLKHQSMGIFLPS